VRESHSQGLAISLLIERLWVGCPVMQLWYCCFFVEQKNYATHIVSVYPAVEFGAGGLMLTAWGSRSPSFIINGYLVTTEKAKSQLSFSFSGVR